MNSTLLQSMVAAPTAVPTVKIVPVRLASQWPAKWASKLTRRNI